MSDDLLFEVRGNVAWLTINRPEKRNSISLEMIDAWHEYLDQIQEDDSVRVVGVTGAGDKVFCAGADLGTTMVGQEIQAGAAKYAGLLKRMARFSKVLVAKVNGHCVAGGLGLMLACDIVYAREGTRFGTPEVNVGLFPMMVAALLFRTVGRMKAREMVYTARMYPAAEAEAMGLITRTISAEEFDAAVDETLARITAKGPLALTMGRRAVAEIEDMGLDDALDFLCRQLGEVVATEDAKEGMLAFLQKREPVWKNR
ncbi:MAG: enoyl-CoA hydratase/isomerase family protein [Proteobacteria bacterium]|nr:enoyl-CoA hydratase/isomerase family protein [Pseudomonadota bacterium]MBU1740135.1 enoyl-CoA hydratase/isomerase family protein [Pseudomonadota bacterium]